MFCQVLVKVFLKSVIPLDVCVVKFFDLVKHLFVMWQVSLLLLIVNVCWDVNQSTLFIFSLVEIVDCNMLVKLLNVYINV